MLSVVVFGCRIWLSYVVFGCRMSYLVVVFSCRVSKKQPKTLLQNKKHAYLRQKNGKNMYKIRDIAAYYGFPVEEMKKALCFLGIKKRGKYYSSEDLWILFKKIGLPNNF